MSNDMISVPRELLERLERIYMDGMSIYGECEEIRALLAQRCSCPSGDGSLRWPCPVHPPADPAWLWGKLMEWCRKRGVSPAGYSDLFELCGMQQGSPECPPEPVAWANDQRLLLCSKSKLDVFHPNPAYHQLPSAIAASALATPYCNTPLYRHPPAQASVVLPHRKCDSCEDSDVFEDAQAEGWNACLDEFKRLNPGITEAAPPRKS